MMRGSFPPPLRRRRLRPVDAGMLAAEAQGGRNDMSVMVGQAYPPGECRNPTRRHGLR
jgi:hypothetical protein